VPMLAALARAEDPVVVARARATKDGSEAGSRPGMLSTAAE
jgi:hypothetical protein